MTNDAGMLKMFYVWEASSCRSVHTFVFYAPHITSEKIHGTKGFNPPPTAWNDFKDGQAKNTIPAHLLNKSLILQIKSHLAHVEFKSSVLLFSD